MLERLERELYIDKVAKRLEISRQSIEEDVKKALRIRNKERTVNRNKQMQNKAMGVGDRVNPEYSANPRAAAAEEAILGIMMLYPEKRVKIASGEIAITEDDFVTTFNKRIFAELMRLHSEGVNDVGVLGAVLTEAEMERVYSIQMKREGLDSASDEVLLDNLTALREARAASETDIEKLLRAKRSGDNK